MKILLVAVFLGVAAAQVPPRCIAPNVFEARVLEVVPSQRFERIGKFSYDALNQRFRIIEELVEGTTREYYDDLILHKEKIGFRFNLKTRQCERFNVTWTFSPIEVPAGATFYSQVYIGSSSVPNAGVLADVFGGESTTEGRYQGVWTQVACLPVTDNHIDPRYGFTHWTFYDATLGISDPNVFIPREECR